MGLLESRSWAFQAAPQRYFEAFEYYHSTSKAHAEVLLNLTATRAICLIQSNHVEVLHGAPEAPQEAASF